MRPYRKWWEWFGCYSWCPLWGNSYLMIIISPYFHQAFSRLQRLRQKLKWMSVELIKRLEIAYCQYFYPEVTLTIPPSLAAPPTCYWQQASLAYSPTPQQSLPSSWIWSEPNGNVDQSQLMLPDHVGWPGRGSEGSLLTSSTLEGFTWAYPIEGIRRATTSYLKYIKLISQ